MPAPTPAALRHRIIIWYNEEHLPTTEVAQRAGVSPRTVQYILKLHATHGQVTNPLALQAGRKRKLNHIDIQYVRSTVDAKRGIYLDELQHLLSHNRDINVSKATLSRTMSRLGISRKKVAKPALERNPLLRAQFDFEMGQYDIEQMVWLDESCVNGRAGQRNQGWAPQGQACVRPMYNARGTNLSALPVLSCNGIIAIDIFEGAINKEKFISFVRNELTSVLNPFPMERSIVIMDNCTIHHDEEIRAIIEGDCGAKLIYLPPYSPDYNPIEEAFSYMKAWLRRQEQAMLEEEARPWLIREALNAVDPELARSWIKNCNYNVD